MTEAPDPGTLRATATAHLDAQGAEAASGVLARATIEVLGESERWRVEGRPVAAHRVALWLDAPDRVLVQQRPEILESLRTAIASALESPGGVLRELIPLQRRVRASAPGPVGPLYRTSASPARIDGPTLARTAAAFLEGSDTPDLAPVLRRAEVVLEPVGAHASRVLVALDPADLAAVQRDSRRGERLREAIETAALDPAHRAADIVLALRPPPAGLPCEGDAEARFAATAEEAGWAVVAIERDPRGATLACVHGGRLVLVRVDSEARAWHTETARVPKFTVPAADLTDEDAARRTLTRIAGG